AAGDGQVEALGAVGGHTRAVVGLGDAAVAGGHGAAGDGVVAGAGDYDVAAGDGRVHDDIVVVLDGRGVVARGDAVEGVAQRLARHQVALAADHVVGTQALTDDDVVASQCHRGPGVARATLDRGRAFRRRIVAHRQRVAGDGV